MDTYDSVLLGERVRRARMARGWKQKELAEITGVPQGNISRIERGQIQYMHLSLALSRCRKRGWVRTRRSALRPVSSSSPLRTVLAAFTAHGSTPWFFS